MRKCFAVLSANRRWRLITRCQQHSIGLHGGSIGEHNLDTVFGWADVDRFALEQLDASWVVNVDRLAIAQ